eukprot:TRINITY_DN4353_c0_g1_i1.p1 TRINITY_DN4353_c0_g1~~TRINITY_DN4353_c0_g1_i1.p1  ORF type:complete len:119 (+),score=14.85 TRINITY_DN4353_c0_g1_i1:349-705(+)
MCFLACTWGNTKMIFDDREGTIYHETPGMSCCLKESIIKYSDCLKISAVLETETITTTNQTTGATSWRSRSHYLYSLVTLDGNYKIFVSSKNLEEAPLNDFLRERLAAYSGSAGMPEV